MRYLLCLSVAVAACWLPASGQFFPASAIADSLLTDAYYVIREEAQVMEIKSPAEGTHRFRQVVTLTGKEKTTFTAGTSYDTESPLLDISARVYDKNGALIRAYKKADFNDVSAVSSFSLYEDNRVKYLEIAHSEYPFTVEWTYEQKVKGIQLALMPDWLIQDFFTSVEHAHFTLVFPKEAAVRHRVANLAIVPEEASVEGRRQYTWRVSGLKAIREEAYAPHPKDVLPQVQLALSNFQIGPYKGSMDSWETFGRFIAGLYQGPAAAPPALTEEIRALTATAADRKEQIRRIYRYVQERMRYVSVQLGIGGWQPFPSAYVYDNHFGDCKALSNFVKVALGIAGIQAIPAIISNGDQSRAIDPAFAHDPGFNHVVIYVPEEDYWLECTSNLYPPNYLGSSNAGRTVLLATEKGGELKTTPALGPEDNWQEWTQAVTLNPEGNSTVQVRAQLAGEPHETYRLAAHLLPGKELDKWMQDELKLPLLALDSLQIEPNRDLPQATLRFNAQLSRLGSRSGPRWFLPLFPLNAVSEVPAKQEDRKQPFSIPLGFVSTNRITYQIPPGYRPESLPKTDSLQSRFGSYQLEVRQGNAEIQILRRLERSPSGGSPEDYHAFAAFMREVAKKDQAKIVLLKE